MQILKNLGPKTKSRTVTSKAKSAEKTKSPTAMKLSWRRNQTMLQFYGNIQPQLVTLQNIYIYNTIQYKTIQQHIFNMFSWANLCQSLDYKFSPWGWVRGCTPKNAAQKQRLASLLSPPWVLCRSQSEILTFGMGHPSSLEFLLSPLLGLCLGLWGPTSEMIQTGESTRESFLSVLKIYNM